jgi:hypothetical protein
MLLLQVDAKVKLNHFALVITLQTHGRQVAIATEIRMKSLVEQDFGLDYMYSWPNTQHGEYLVHTMYC